MKATNKEISQQFSEGNFPFCYEYFAADIEWEVIGNEITKSKKNVILQCDKMMKEITPSALKNTNIIAGNENVVIEGICNYTDADNKPAELAYCDVFRFENDKIASITSYCIEKKI